MRKLLWLALFGWQLPAMAAGVEAIVLNYQVKEVGIPVYPSRIVVTADHVRMDDGVDQGDFVLFDRNERRIYSVSHGDETVLDIPQRAVPAESPEPITRGVEVLTVDDNVPLIGGSRPVHRRLLVNGDKCHEVVAVPGIVDDAVEALKAFRQVLAGEHASLLPTMPADLRDSCDLAIHTFFPTWQLEFGLPIQSWGADGSAEALVDYSEKSEVAPALFVLPEGYRHYMTGPVE